MCTVHEMGEPSEVKQKERCCNDSQIDRHKSSVVGVYKVWAMITSCLYCYCAGLCNVPLVYVDALQKTWPGAGMPSGALEPWAS